MADLEVKQQARRSPRRIEHLSERALKEHDSAPSSPTLSSGSPYHSPGWTRAGAADASGKQGAGAEDVPLSMALPGAWLSGEGHGEGLRHHPPVDAGGVAPSSAQAKEEEEEEGEPVQVTMGVTQGVTVSVELRSRCSSPTGGNHSSKLSPEGGQGSPAYSFAAEVSPRPAPSPYRAASPGLLLPKSPSPPPPRPISARTLAASLHPPASLSRTLGLMPRPLTPKLVRRPLPPLNHEVGGVSAALVEADDLLSSRGLASRWLKSEEELRASAKRKEVAQQKLSAQQLKAKVRKEEEVLRAARARERVAVQTLRHVKSMLLEETHAHTATAAAAAAASASASPAGTRPLTTSQSVVYHSAASALQRSRSQGALPSLGSAADSSLLGGRPSSGAIIPRATGPYAGPAAGPTFPSSHYRRTLMASSHSYSERLRKLPLSRDRLGASLVRVYGPLSIS